MLPKEVKDWLAEYKGLSPTEIHSFASTLGNNEDLVMGLYDLFETPPFQVQELDPVCHQLYEFYRSKEKRLMLFALQFVPVLTWLYLRCLSCNDKKNSGGVETFLLGIYNLEIVHPDGNRKVESFRIPTVSRSSIYHECRITGQGELLTEHNLRQLNNIHGTWRSGPYKQYERFNAQNRFTILSYITLVFNNHIDTVHSLSLEAVCRVTARLSLTGFESAQDGDAKFSRISLQPSLLIELLSGIYFAMFNGHSKNALSAVEAANERAAYELYSDVLLVTNGLMNSNQQNKFFVENVKGLQKSKKTSLMKNLLTNASFKAKKLPDDIDIVTEDTMSMAGRLATVDEEASEHGHTKGLKARLMTKLGGEKAKLKDEKKKDSVDATWNNAGRRDSEASGAASTSSHYQMSLSSSPRDGMGGGSSPRRGSEILSVDSIGVAVVNNLGGDKSSEGRKVVVDVLEMQPISSNVKGSKVAREVSEESGDFFSHQLYEDDQVKRRHSGAKHHTGLFEPPDTPTPTSAPEHSPLLSYNSGRKSKTQQHDTSIATPSSQISHKNNDGSTVRDASPSPSQTANGKPSFSDNSSRTRVRSSNSSSSIGRHSSSGVNNGYQSYHSMSEEDKSSENTPRKPTSVSFSKTSPSLASEQDKSQTVNSSSSASKLPSPRDVFFGKVPSPEATTTSSESPPSAAPSVSPNATEQTHRSAQVKVNRNSFSTDL